MGSSKLQKAYAKKETTYGAGVSGDFSGATGVRLHHASDGPIDVSNIVQKLSAVKYTIGALDELRPAAVSTTEEITLSIPIVVSGNTRVSDDYTEDNLDTLLSELLTDPDYAAASDACAAGCTATSIIVAGSATFAADDLIRINGETRCISSWTAGTKTIVVTLPFTSAPAAAVIIYNMAKYDTAGDSGSIAIGLTHDTANADYLINGVFAESIKLSTLNGKDEAKLEIGLRGQSASVGSGLITAVSTNDIETDVISAKAGGKVQLLRADGVTLLTLCSRDAEAAFGTKNIPVEGIAVNGICGYSRAPEDDMGTLKITAWESDAATRELLVALIGSTTEIVVQLGSTAKCCGVYYKAAMLKEKEPRFVDMNGVVGIEATFETVAGWFFRG
jgi:hypothetical protein